MADKTLPEMIDHAGEVVARELLAHPMLHLIITSGMAKNRVPLTETNKVAMVDSVIRHLKMTWENS